MENFNLERLLNDRASGNLDRFEFFIDPAHGGKDDHVDLHVFLPEVGGKKYSGLGGANDLRQQLPWLQDGQKVTERNF
jgi:hypothetical protein